MQFTTSDYLIRYRCLYILGDAIQEEPGHQYHDGMQFTTGDHDQDLDDDDNCARMSGDWGGWWYNDCFRANLNYGPYKKERVTPRRYGIIWEPWKGWFYSLKATEMKIKPATP
jgi:ficolin